MNDSQGDKSPTQQLMDQFRKMLRTITSKNGRRVITLSSLLLVLIFSIYLTSLYRELERAFHKKEQYLPTVIYSDVSKIAPPQNRAWIERRLKSVGYNFVSEEESVRFRLRPIDYPTYLLPPNHVTETIQDQLIVMSFDGPGDKSFLISIEAAGYDVPEFFLEPEVVTRLSRANDDETGQIRAYTQLEDIPAPVWRAIIAIEDQHFLEHPGLDPKAFLRAIWVNLRSFSFKQGGSTITQQLVKNLMVRRTKNLFKKFNEIFLSLILETRYDKETILERYLNEVYLGQIGNLEIHGVTEGAKYFFGKTVDQLNLAEITLMAGLIRGPGYYSPYRHLDRASQRQRLVLKKMVETGHLSQEEAIDALAMPYRLAPPPQAANKAPYFTDYVKAELNRRLTGRLTEQEITNVGFRVYTTLDVHLNDLAQAAVERGVEHLKSELPVEGALASVDHRTGNIRALVGGSQYSKTTFNRILNMRRQVGSTFKPVVYLTGINNGYGPGTPMEDRQWTLTYDQGRKKWRPKNYKKEYRGWISLREAFIHSVNTVAARMGALVGLEAIVETASLLGLPKDLALVPSLSLGVTELSPIELLGMYSTIANQGKRDELTVIKGITYNDGRSYARFVYQPRQVVDPASVELLLDMMQDVFKDGTARAATSLGFDRPAAGKTGTTSDHRDSWFAGFTPQLTTVVWIGLDEGTSKDEKTGKVRLLLSGAGSALPVWIDFMQKAHESIPPELFPEPQYLSSVRIDQFTGARADFNCPDSQVLIEKIIPARAPTEFTCALGYPPSPNQLTLPKMTAPASPPPEE